MAHDFEPRIYVACLAAYNAGTLHGTWIDLSGKSVEEVEEEIQAMLKDSPVPGAEEYAIHNYEGFCGYKVAQHESLGELVALVEDAEATGEPAAFMAYVDHVGGAPGRSKFEDAFCGEWEDEEAYCWNYLEDTGSLPDGILAAYFDIKAFTEDVFSGDCFSIESPRGVYVFRNI